ncbi:DUF4387 domain-containing protein [Variovorax beijingensis]|uniref:DUF4387 domain-containing protein n=1 Tax=Variovorax beijingensis TaxID=2496117 RepID=A0A3P3EKA8_9BURK|nr:DUF4387 domain-containing protein [Variovorax beijingensis]RRH86780.1 DUF4387 domain-containing protein [Variovorax beijingensis]RSZ32825.1 DUF4387 domain-containing protein [Variovorax beijingensis]
MPKLREVCHHIRSKVAGPFWVTVDLFFDGEEKYRKYRDCEELSPELFHRLYGVDPSLVKRIPVDSLHVLKISFPRASPQGGMVERDMHSGQQYVRLLDIELKR